jgi:hypothetical protein
MENGDLLFKSLTYKKMSKIEKSFYNHLFNGLSKHLVLANNFLDTSEYNIMKKSVDDDELDYWFVNTSLYKDMNGLIKDNVLGNDNYFKDFFLIGSFLAYKQLSKVKGSLFNKYDKQAMNILLGYEHKLLYDLNVEMGIGVRNTLYDGLRNNESRSETKKKILTVMMAPVLSNVSLVRRLELIARTEHSRGVNTGTLQGYSNNGVDEVDIVTSGMSNVCSACLGLEANNPYTLSEAMSLLPFHPLCNCSYYPVSSNGVVGDVVIVDLT